MPNMPISSSPRSSGMPSIVRPDPGYASEEHDRQQRKGPGDEFDLARLNEARLEVSPRVRPSVPPSEYERREHRRNDDREHDDERSDHERQRRLADDSFGMEDDELLAARQREQCEHGSAAESNGGRRSTFESGARSQGLAREGLERTSHLAALLRTYRRRSRDRPGPASTSLAGVSHRGRKAIARPFGATSKSRNAWSVRQRFQNW